MKKRIAKFAVIVTILYLVTTGFSSWNKNTVIYNVPNTNFVITVPKVIEEPKPFNAPFVGKSYIGFKEAVGFAESRGDYDKINTLGYLGKYQFGRTTLKQFNIHNSKKFLNDPKLQENAFLALCSVNKWILKKDIKRSVGKRINGIKITESGILAAAHLAGAGSVQKFLRSNGEIGFEDAYGTPIEYYMKKFAGYDTSFIEANLKPAF